MISYNNIIAIYQLDHLTARLWQVVQVVALQMHLEWGAAGRFAPEERWISE